MSKIRRLQLDLSGLLSADQAGSCPWMEGRFGPREYFADLQCD